MEIKFIGEIVEAYFVYHNSLQSQTSGFNPCSRPPGRSVTLNPVYFGKCPDIPGNHNETDAFSGIKMFHGDCPHVLLIVLLPVCSFYNFHY